VPSTSTSTASTAFGAFGIVLTSFNVFIYS
jgi:hypothetical protein